MKDTMIAVILRQVFIMDKIALKDASDLKKCKINETNKNQWKYVANQRNLNRNQWKVNEKHGFCTFLKLMPL